MSIHYFRFTLADMIDRQRAPLLESLLARADVSRETRDWRVDAFRLLAPPESMPGVGAAACFSQLDGEPLPHGVPRGAWVYMATPVHYVAEMSNVRLAPDGVVSLKLSEALRLAADFNGVWKDAGLRLAVGGRADLFCVMDQPLRASTHDPEDVRGRHIESYLPTGEAAPRLRRLMSEIEMWLFEHDVNRERAAGAAPLVNGLWLWGGGPALSSLPPIKGWTAGNDPLFAVWTDARLDAGVDAGARLPARARADSGVAVIAAQPGTVEWGEMELNWLRPSIRALRARRIERLELSSGHRAFTVGPMGLWRLWRRPRPWWECFR